VASPYKPGSDVPGIALQVTAAARVRDDVDHLGQVDHHQPAVVHEQVVRGQVAVRVASARQCRHGLHQLTPEDGELGRVGARLGEAGRAGTVRITDELEQEFRPQDLYRIGDRNAGVVELDESVELRVRPLAGDCLSAETATVRDGPVDPAFADPTAFQISGVTVELPVGSIPIPLGGKQARPICSGHATADEKYVSFFSGLEDAKLVVNRREVGYQPLRVRLGTTFSWC